MRHRPPPCRSRPAAFRPCRQTAPRFRAAADSGLPAAVRAEDPVLDPFLPAPWAVSRSRAASVLRRARLPSAPVRSAGYRPRPRRSSVAPPAEYFPPGSDFPVPAAADAAPGAGPTEAAPRPSGRRASFAATDISQKTDSYIRIPLKYGRFVQFIRIFKDSLKRTNKPHGSPRENAGNRPALGWSGDIRFQIS